MKIKKLKAKIVEAAKKRDKALAKYDKAQEAYENLLQDFYRTGEKKGKKIPCPGLPR